MTSQSQQTQTQESNAYAMYDQSFDFASTVARFVSISNTDRFETVTLLRRAPGHVYTFGRHKSCDFMLTGNRFSNIHFRVWEAETDESAYGDLRSVVIVEDMSTNGTYLNQARIGKGQTTVLANGDELAAGVGIAADEARYVVQLPKRSRPDMQSSLSPEADACRQKYEIRQILGAGAFATVRYAVQRSNGAPFAVKILNQRKLAITNANAKATELFKREIEILQSTRHPNIVQYVDMWADATEIYLVLEFLAGGDLMDYIMRRGKLTEPATVSIVRQVLDALVYCHRIGIAHRDIKPENILLTTDNPPIAKLTDFGLAKMVEPGSFLKTFCGTLTYVAPEVISMHGRTAGAYSTAVDMWSVGCITFVMLTGTMPFVAEGQDAMMQIIQEGDYDDAMLDEVELSGAGLDFVESLLRVNPESRMTGEQAISHPWIAQSDYFESLNNESNNPYRIQPQLGQSDMDSTSQEEGSVYVSKRLPFDAHPASIKNPPPSRPTTGKTYGLRDESSVDWSNVENGQGALYSKSQRQSYLAEFHACDHAQNQSSNPMSHFSHDSSYHFLGSSQYVSASSKVEESNATITPQRIRAQQQQGLMDRNMYGESEKENVFKARQYESEPVFRH